MKIRHRYNFKYFWKEGFSGIFLHGFMSLAAVSVIVACLLITGSVALMAYNINLEILDLQSQSEIAIYIDDSVSREDALAMEPELSALDNVRSVTFVSREQVFEEFKESQGADSEIFEGLEGEDNPARDCYRIQLDDIARLDETVTALENVPGVANVVTQSDTAAALVRVQRGFEVLSYGLVIALGFVSIFIISNTVKLGMFTRRDEIGIMKMVGATNWFIRWPFIIEGMILGVTGALIAFFAQWGVYHQIQQVIADTIGIITIAEFSTVARPLLGIFVLAGVVIGVCGSAFSIRRFLDV